MKLSGSTGKLYEIFWKTISYSWRFFKRMEKGYTCVCVCVCVCRQTLFSSFHVATIALIPKSDKV